MLQRDYQPRGDRLPLGWGRLTRDLFETVKTDRHDATFCILCMLILKSNLNFKILE